MTAQQQQNKSTFWSKVTTAATTLCTAVMIWYGSVTVKMYDAFLLQPKINEQQTAAILSIIAEQKQFEIELSSIKNEQTRLGGRIIYLEAIMPDKNQFKVKK